MYYCDQSILLYIKGLEVTVVQKTRIKGEKGIAVEVRGITNLHVDPEEDNECISA